MPKFKPVSLARHFNATARPSGKLWHEAARDLWPHMHRGSQSYWGIPFRLGPKDARKKGLVVLKPGGKAVEVPLRGRASHLCFAHFCDASLSHSEQGVQLAEYVIRYADGSEHVQPIRFRFEVAPFQTMWGMQPFAAAPVGMPDLAKPEMQVHGWGQYQTGVSGGGPGGCATWVYALENPRPEARLASVVLRAVGKVPVAVLGLTYYDGPGHPLRHVPRRVYLLVLPAQDKMAPEEFEASLDLGVVTRAYAVPAKIDESWLEAPERGLGLPRREPKPTREFLIHATAAEGATLTAGAGRKTHKLALGRAFSEGTVGNEAGARLELLQPRTAWVHVTVVDESTGKPTPTRVHFCGKHGEYLPPYGHHEVVNDRWFEDYGGDLQLGGMSYAYVPGRFQIELPLGDVFCEVAKGFEYAPLRRKLEIKPGQRELELRIDRAADWRRDNWITADTHVHFISPDTAWLEGQGEGLNLINLLASQWGKLFTNVADITGEAAGCSREDTIVWVGTENRHHLLGHMSMLGAHGDPVFPMCAGGPHEAYIGDPDVVTLTEWAQTCRERDGVSIRPHFPSPICEEPVYFLLDQLDGAELRRYANPDAGSLDEFCFSEWYRYLNCGCRVAAVGGTDKMSAGMPVGGSRTYAQLGRDEEFSFENWGKAVRAGRTFTSSGPLIDLRVDGKRIGDEIQLPDTGGTLEVEAHATCVWPMNKLEVVVNGTVVAASERKAGVLELSLKKKLRIKRSAWIAARCGSRMMAQHCWPIHLGAHTSPVYVIVGGRELFSESDATYMLTLIDGGLTYLDTLSVRYDDERHRQMKGIFEKARAELKARRSAHRHPHPH